MKKSILLLALLAWAADASAQVSFNVAPAFAVGSGPASVAIGDLNGDGRPDLATANRSSNNVSVLLASGAPGNFAAAVNFGVGAVPLSVAIGDLNGDGRPDLATANSVINTVSALLNTTGGSDYTGSTAGITPSFYNNVTFTAGGNLPSGVTVLGTLTLNAGVVSNLNGNTITVANSASGAVAGAGSLTGSGSLARAFNGNNAYAFPYSQDGNDRTATVQFTSGAGRGTLTYQFFNAPPGNAGLPQTILGQNISVVAPYFWRIDATGAPGNYTLSLRGQNTGGITNVSTLRIVKRPNGGNWSATGIGTGNANAGTPADPTIVQSGMTGFSEFTIGSDPASNPLPVELSAFTGEAVRKGVRLSWTTASETNNSGFEVQRRMENVGAGIENDWKVLGFVKGRGTTSEAQSYSFLDRTASGKMQYRLKQVDFDGSFEYSPIIEVEAGLPRTFELSQNYPNPFNPTTVIGYQLPVASEVSLKIYDMLGREVAVLVNGRQEAGRYQAQFNASGLASGLYFYRLQAGSFAETKKMMLVK